MIDGAHSDWISVTATTTGNVDPPHAPDVGLAAGMNQITVDWDAPYDLGGAITGYELDYKLSTASNWSDWTHDDTTTVSTITGLTNGSVYDVRVRTQNSAGWGKWSHIVSHTPRSTFDVPQFWWTANQGLNKIRMHVAYIMAEATSVVVGYQRADDTTNQTGEHTRTATQPRTHFDDRTHASGYRWEFRTKACIYDQCSDWTSPWTELAAESHAPTDPTTKTRVPIRRIILLRCNGRSPPTMTAVRMWRINSATPLEPALLSSRTRYCQARRRALRTPSLVCSRARLPGCSCARLCWGLTETTWAAP